MRLDQFPPNNQRINQFFTISESCTPGDSADDLEAEFLPDFYRGRVVFEDQVEDGVFVALPLLIPRVIEDRHEGKGIPISAHTRDTSRPWQFQHPCS